jgi:hypothetical protein
MATAAALLRDVDSSTERSLDRARTERCFRRGGVSQMSAGRPQLERAVCDATTPGGLLVAIDPARTGEVPGAVVGRLVAGEPGAIAVGSGALRPQGQTVSRPSSAGP